MDFGMFEHVRRCEGSVFDCQEVFCLVGEYEGAPVCGEEAFFRPAWGMGSEGALWDNLLRLAPGWPGGLSDVPGGVYVLGFS